MNTTILAERLKLLRIRKNYTQKEVCSQTHLSRSSYSNYENGIRIPTIDILTVLADFLHLAGLSGRYHRIPVKISRFHF